MDAALRVIPLHLHGRSFRGLVGYTFRRRQDSIEHADITSVHRAVFEPQTAMFELSQTLRLP